MTGGFLADRFSKRSVTAGLEVVEIGVMIIALAGLAATNLWIAAGALTTCSARKLHCSVLIEVWPAAGAAAGEAIVVGATEFSNWVLFSPR